MKKVLICLVFCVLSVLTVFGQRANNWQRVEDDKYKIAFSAPNKPEKVSRFSGKIPVVVYQTKNNIAVMGIVCSDFAQGGIQITGETTARLYEEMKAGSLEIPTAILKKEQTVPFNDMLVKEIEYTVISNRQEMTYFKRFIFRDGVVFQMTIGGRTRHRAQLEELKGMFFGSLSFKE
ncbi:MAG: hypothetical protein ACRDDZ_02910 [Marinifilaceae bacterium]